MPRVPRSSLPDGYFHVYCRGVDGRDAFTDGDDRDAFLDLLRPCGRRFGLRWYAACVLSTHYHLVLAATREALSAGLQAINWRYARFFNKRHERHGHVFSERFGTRVIEGEDRVFETCAYVLLNPVKAGLCERVEEWPWSYSRYGLAAS